jgi:hypothetical protein
VEYIRKGSVSQYPTVQIVLEFAWKSLKEYVYHSELHIWT